MPCVNIFVKGNKFYPNRKYGVESLTGFTLIEILVVLAILGVIATSLVIVFKTSTDAYKKSDDLVEVYQEGRAILERMTKELQCAYILDVDPPGTDITFLGFDNETTGRSGFKTNSIKDELFFVAALPVKDNMDLAEVGYWLNSDPKEGLERHLDRADKNTDPPLDFVFSTGSSQPIASNVTDLQFQYLPEGGVWENTWDSSDTGAEKGTLPKAIMITVAITKGRLSKTFSTQVAMPPK